MNRSPIRVLVLALTAALTALVAAVPAQAAAAPYCGITWGSLPKQAGNSDPSLQGSELTAVRVGQHGCYDRLVLDTTGGTRIASYRVEYVPVVRSDASGAIVPLSGGAFLQINLGVNDATAPPAHRGDVANVSGFRTFREVAAAGGFEGHTSEGLGVRARLPFRVFTLSGPGSTARVVIDVAHAW
jgi:hypothetical protein